MTAPNGEDTCAVSIFTKTGLNDQEDDGEKDECGDLVGKETKDAHVCGLTIQCGNVGGTSTSELVSVPSCTTYKQPGGNAVCLLDTTQADPFNLPTLQSVLPGTPSKCECEALDFNINIRRCTLEANCNLSTISEQCLSDVTSPIIEAGTSTTESNKINEVFTVTSSLPCSGLEMSLFEQDNGGSGCEGSPRTLLRTYTLSDSSARTGDVTCTQTISVEDLTPPTLTAGPNKTAECPTCTTNECFDTPTVNDNCGSSTVTVTNSTAFTRNTTCSSGKSGTYEMKFTAKDLCNLTATDSQFVEVSDTTGPTISNCPTNAEMVDLCGDIDLTQATASSVTVSDTCDGSGSATLTCCFDPSLNKAVRTWSAKDSCGNEATSCTQDVGISTSACE